MKKLFKIGADDVAAFHRCVCNEYDSIVNRHVVKQLSCGEQEIVAMIEVAEEIITRLRHMGLQRLTKDEVIFSRPARMKKRYRNVRDKELVNKIGKSFIKFEKHPIKHTEAIPRLIQYRSSEYTLSLARYTIVMEEAIKFKDTFSLENNGGFPFVSKGLNALQKGKILRRMWDNFKNPVAHLIDHSKFDSMVNEFHQLLERYMMVKIFDCDTLDWLYSFQSDNKFISQNGIKYTFPFRRCSGDANTSLGNSLINYCILRACYPKSYIIVDGDDSVVFTEAGVESRFDFTKCGMNTKHEVTDLFEQVEFCQSRPVKTRIGWVMCRNPTRAISRMNVRLGQCKDMKDFLWTVGIGEGLASSFMPIISSFAKRFRSLGFGGRFKPWELDYRIKIDRFTNRFEYPCPETRASFAIAWGISVDEQHAIENRLARAVLYT
jgi:hypothetical protein